MRCGCVESGVQQLFVEHGRVQYAGRVRRRHCRHVEDRVRVRESDGHNNPKRRLYSRRKRHPFDWLRELHVQRRWDVHDHRELIGFQRVSIRARLPVDQRLHPNVRSTRERAHVKCKPLGHDIAVGMLANGRGLLVHRFINHVCDALRHLYDRWERIDRNTNGFSGIRSRLLRAGRLQAFHHRRTEHGDCNVRHHRQCRPRAHEGVTGGWRPPGRPYPCRPTGGDHR